MSISRAQDFPRVARNPQMMSGDNFVKYMDDADIQDFSSTLRNLLESPIISDPMSDDLTEVKGYINSGSLRRLPQFWDAFNEDLEVTFVEALEEDPETYEGTIHVREKLPQGVTADPIVYNQGAVVLTGYPEEMDIETEWDYHFKVNDRDQNVEFDSVEEKIDEIFEDRTYDLQQAIDVINVDYDEFRDYKKNFSSLPD